VLITSFSYCTQPTRREKNESQLSLVSKGRKEAMPAGSQTNDTGSIVKGQSDGSRDGAGGDNLGRCLVRLDGSGSGGGDGGGEDDSGEEGHGEHDGKRE
jgi:hypothetical protein